MSGFREIPYKLRDGESWDRYYQDPTSDILFRSSDGVILATSLWRLAQESDVFKDMRESMVDDSFHPIDTDACGEALSQVLDQCGRPGITMYDTTMENAMDIYDFAKLFSMDRIVAGVEKLLTMPRGVYGVVGWYLVEAGRRNHLAVGKLLLHRLTINDLVEWSRFSEWMQELPDSWCRVISRGLFGKTISKEQFSQGARYTKLLEEQVPGECMDGIPGWVFSFEEKVLASERAAAARAAARTIPTSNRVLRRRR